MEPVENPYAPPTTHTSPDMSEASASEFDELRCFVGTNANYYLRKWSSVLKNQGGTCGFNWAGFFLTVFWLAYRKMYLTTFLLFAIMTVESIGEELLFVWYLGYEETPNAVVLGIGLLIGATVGFFGNAWYLAHARKAILEVRSRGLDEAMTRQTLSNRGGTHLLNAFGLFLLYFMIMLVVFLGLDMLLNPEDYAMRGWVVAMIRRG